MLSAIVLVSCVKQVIALSHNMIVGDVGKEEAGNAVSIQPLCFVNSGLVTNMLYELNFRAATVVEILSPEAEKRSFNLERK